VPEAEQMEADVAVVAKAQRPKWPADAFEQFRQGKRVEREIALLLRAFARLGEVATSDGGKTFELRRVA
jgi:hypothetical protein